MRQVMKRFSNFVLRSAARAQFTFNKEEVVMSVGCGIGNE